MGKKTLHMLATCGIAAVVLAGSVPGAPREGSLLTLPMSRPPVLTSSFGEFRSGHYHGGLDFSTGGSIGHSVVAPRHGWVFRIRCSGVGYGRSVYFRIPDGRTVLFAHLDRFNPRLEAVVAAEQDRLGRYEIDLHPQPGRLAFAEGEVLGYSGESGAGPPHLHAEIRTGADAAVAVNPEDQGWLVPDTTPPRLLRLRLEPVRPGVRINGGLDPVVVDWSQTESPRVRVTGPVRMWVEADDRGAAGKYRLAPREIVMAVDGSAVFRHGFDAFNWNWAREVEWTFHNPSARAHNQRWIVLEPPPGGRQKISSWLAGGENWWETLALGDHELRLTAADASGNRGERVLALILEAQDLSGRVPDSAQGTERLRSRGDFLEWWEPAASPSSPESLRMVGPRGDVPDPGWLWQQTHSGSWVGQLGAPTPAHPGLWRVVRNQSRGIPSLAVWLPGFQKKTEVGSSPVRVEFDGGRIRFPRGASYGPLWVGIERVEGSSAPSDNPELTPAGDLVRLSPWAAPLRERIRVELDAPGSRKGLGVYSLENESWSFEGSDTTGAGVAATLRQLRSLCLFRDDMPPRIEMRRPKPGPRPRLEARIVDGGAGVSWKTLALSVDGDAMIAEWDPDTKLLTAHLRQSLSSGRHTLTVMASDRVGNRTTQSRAFSVP